MLDKELKVLLVEDEQEECKNIVEYAGTLDDISIIAVTNSADAALKYIKDYLPDAVILDLELHQGGGNGVKLLQELRILNPIPSPYVLVTTNNTSSVTLATARQLGADFIMVKTQQDYSAQSVVDFLRALRTMIFNIQNRTTTKSNYAAEETPSEKQKRLYTRVASELERIGISPKAIGRKYIIDGILEIYDGKSHNIRGIIAEKYSKSDASVERAMQNAINAAWRKSDIETLQNYYTARISSVKGIPTITEFMHYYADKLKTEY